MKQRAKQYSSFESKYAINPVNGCWEWKYAADRHGYGRVAAGPGKISLAHRVSYERAHGLIPDGMYVLHRCNNPRCVNPEHLYCGTQKENHKDLVDAGNYYPPPHPSGCSHPRAKLSASRVKKLRSMYGRGKLKQRELAKIFLLSQPVVGRIVRRESYVEIE